MKHTLRQRLLQCILPILTACGDVTVEQCHPELYSPRNYVPESALEKDLKQITTTADFTFNKASLIYETGTSLGWNAQIEYAGKKSNSFIPSPQDYPQISPPFIISCYTVECGDDPQASYDGWMAQCAYNAKEGKCFVGKYTLKGVFVITVPDNNVAGWQNNPDFDHKITWGSFGSIFGFMKLPDDPTIPCMTTLDGEHKWENYRENCNRAPCETQYATIQKRVQQTLAKTKF